LIEEPDNHLVWTPTYDYVAQKIRENKRLELIIAPYIKREALKQLLDECEDLSNLKVIVRWDAQDIIAGVSDIEIYEDLRAKGIPLYRHPSIHLKMLVFNQNWAFHTSGNITQSGLGLRANPNIEVGAQIQLGTKDWIEIHKLLEQAVLIDDELYEKAFEYKEANKSKPDPLPPLDLEPTDDKAFSRFSLPAVQSPEKLYEIYQDPDAFKNDDELFSAFVHDISLYEIASGLGEEQFLGQLGINFRKHPFSQAISEFVKESGSARFGEINQWITDQCSDNPTPYRWEIKETTNKLYDWLDYFFEEITWDVPGARSQVIYWKGKGS
tara:strand:- start:9852 stop:10826 length:975 start_codon:yes stop_codon:yes gene_type:complete